MNRNILRRGGLQTFSARCFLLGAVLTFGSGSIVKAADTTAPYIWCGDPTLPMVGWAVDELWCDAVVSPDYFPVTASDDSGQVTVALVRDDGRPTLAPYPLGHTWVTRIAKDPSGNTSTCRQFIEVYGVSEWTCPLSPQFLITHLRDTVIEVRNTYNTDLSKFNAAINYLNKALDPTRWIGEMPKEGAAGEGVFSNGKSAAGQLVPLQSKYPKVIAILYRLVDTDREIVTTVIDAAPASANLSKLNTAKTYLAKADAHVKAGQVTDSIDDYKTAWKNAAAAY